MGQRTQILIVKENRNGERSFKFEHYQWGYGRSMYMRFLSVFANDYLGLGDVENTDELLHGPNGEWQEMRSVLGKLDFDDFQTVRNVFKFGDNNNGGMVIYRKQGKFGEGDDVKIGFMLGRESNLFDAETKTREEPFSRWLTPTEYGERNGGAYYSDKDFCEIFDRFCKYFGIEYFKNKEADTTA